MRMVFAVLLGLLAGDDELVAQVPEGFRVVPGTLRFSGDGAIVA